MKTVSLWAKMQQQRREKLTFANDWHSEETLWSEEEFVWSQDLQETDSESENQKMNSKQCKQKYKKWRQFQQWIMFQQKHKIKRYSSNKSRKKKSILISCNNCKRKKEKLWRVKKQKQNNEIFLTALLFLLFCISFSQLSISIHSNKMTSSLKTFVVDMSATLISSRVSSEINMITMLFLKYLTFMSSLKTLRVSYFEEKNMIDFLERYEDFCDDYELNQIDWFRNLSRYCNKIINDSIKTMIKYINFNWQELKKIMKKKYEKDDTNQQLNSWIFLKIFKNKSCIMKNDLKLYSRQYKSISHSLIKRKQMNEYIRCCWFVKSLLSILSEKIIQKCALNSEDFSFMNFKKASDAIVIYCDSVKALLKFSIMIKNFNDLSKLVNEYQIKQSTMSDKFFDSLIVVQLNNTTMNEIINKFETMMLSLQTATKKIESFMQNMTASVLMLNVYISCELITSAHSAMLMSSLFSLLKSEWASSMSRMKECFFCKKIKCQKIRCYQLNIYKIEEKIHVNETNRLWMKLTERSDRLTSFALSHSQKELIDNALKKQSQQMRAKHINVIRLTSVRAMITKKAENTDEKQKWNEEVMIVTAQHNYKSDENATKIATQQKMSLNWTWRKKVREEEHLSSMKNLRSEEYLLISKTFLKKWTSENVIMQNAAVFEKTVKTMKKSMKKNSDDSKIKSDNWDKRTQNIVEKCIDTEDVMHIIVNQKMQDVSIE